MTVTDAAGHTSGPYTAVTDAIGVWGVAGMDLSGLTEGKITYTATALDDNGQPILDAKGHPVTAQVGGMLSRKVSLRLVLTSRAPLYAGATLTFVAQLLDNWGTALALPNVLVTVSSSPGDPSGTMTRGTNASGTATFSDLSLSKTGAHTLTAVANQGKTTKAITFSLLLRR